jgi:hypothetical protein
MKLSAALVGVCCSLALLASCKKNDETDKPLSAIGKMLVDGKWQMTAYTGTVNYMGTDTTIDLFAQEDDCDKDDFVLYFSNGTATIDENTNKCADDDQVGSLKWELQNNDTRLALVDANPDTFDLEATPTQIKISMTAPNSSGIPMHLVWTYKNIR